MLTSHATEFDAHFRANLPFHASSSGAVRVRTLACKDPQKMAKEALMTLEGQIDEILPDGRFRVVLENEHKIIAYTAGKMRKFRIRSVVGDRVHVEMTPYDLEKGRIVFRERTPGVGPGPRRGARR